MQPEPAGTQPEPVSEPRPEGRDLNELDRIISMMRSSYLYFGFSNPDREALYEALRKRLSQDSLDTIHALQPRETAGSKLVFFRHQDRVLLGESMISSKGPNGEKDGGLE